jgi:hypothetical protein
MDADHDFGIDDAHCDDDFEEKKSEARERFLQESDPDHKNRLFEKRVSNELEAVRSSLQMMQKCVETFAVSVDQLTKRLEHAEALVTGNKTAIDAVLTQQHLRIQDLESWRVEQRRLAAKRHREESAGASAVLGPKQTLRKKEWDRMKPSGQKP